MRPILVYLYGANMKDDCCAANFERAIFMYKPVVDLAKKFKCIKSSAINDALRKRFSLNPKKPAVLLLDAEGGLIHKVQRCTDPRRYLKVIRSAYALNGKRVKMKERFLGHRRAARELITARDYRRALKSLDKLLAKRDLLMGSVQAKVEADLLELESIADRMLREAEDLREGDDLLSAYELYRKVEREFAHLDEFGRTAKKEARAVRSELRKLGVSLR